VTFTGAIVGVTGAVVGVSEGSSVGAAIGERVGAEVGSVVGAEVATSVGAEVGSSVGVEVGASEGDSDGSIEVTLVWLVVGVIEGVVDVAFDGMVVGVVDGSMLTGAMDGVPVGAVSSDGELVGDDVTGDTVTTTDGCADSSVEGGKVGEVVGSPGGTVAVGATVADGANDPISVAIASSTFLHIVMRLSAMKGEFSTSKEIAASFPTQQFGVNVAIEQKHAPYTKLLMREKGRSEYAAASIAPLERKLMKYVYSSSEIAESRFKSLAKSSSTQP
jgi:hypothetical protein